jgi:pimeloyl-ACP methyl ester carboxylesterase
MIATPISQFHLIPGNPGAVDFYTEFKLLLSHELSISVDHIHVAHHPGHSVTTINEVALGLDALIQYHANQMIYMYDAVEMTSLTDHRIHLMGHSLGGYIAIRVADMLRHTHPTLFARFRLHLICPTIIRMRDSPNGQQLDRWEYTALDLGSHLMAWIPLGFAYMSVPHTAMGTIWCKQVVDNVLMLWADERISIYDMPVVADEVWRKTRIMMSVSDGWTPLDVRTDIRRQVSLGGGTYTEVAVDHSFIMNREDTMAVVRWVGGGL